MPTAVPYRFAPGTTAASAQVNANFDALKAAIDLIPGAPSVPAGRAVGLTLQQYLTNQAEFNVKDGFGGIPGAAGDGVTFDDAAIQATVAACQAAGGGRVIFPPAPAGYRLRTGFVVSDQGVVLVGLGGRAVVLLLDNIADGMVGADFICANPALTLSGCGMVNITIKSTGVNAFQRIGIRLTDVSEFYMDQVSSHYTNITAGRQTTAPSIGLQIRGREVTAIRRCTFFSDRPVDVQPDPRYAPQPQPISLDMFHFFDLYTSALGSNQANVNIGVGCGVVDNNHFDTWIATLGKYALYWNDTAASVDTIYLTVSNLRYEQAADPSGATIYIAKNATLLYHLILHGVAFGSTGDGAYLRRVAYTTAQNVHYAGTSGAKKVFDVDDTCRSILLINNWWNVGAGYSFLNHTLVYGAGRHIFVDTAHIPIAYYEADSAGLATGAFRVGNRLKLMRAAAQLIGGATEFGVQNSGETRTNFSISDAGSDLQMNDGTRLFRANVETAGGEFVDGHTVQSGSHGIMMVPGRGTGTAGLRGVLGYLAGGTPRSALEWENVAAGFATMKMLRSGGTSTHGGRHAGNSFATAYAAAMTIDSSLGNRTTITPTNGVAFTINAPSNPVAFQRLTVTIRNTFGVLGAVTWNGVFKIDAWVNPANGFSRSIEFEYDGANWIQLWRGQNDVPN